MKKQSLKISRWAGWIPVCLLAVAAFTVTACSDDDDDNIVPEPFTKDLTFTSAAKDTVLVFNAYADWKASVTKSDVVEIKSAKTGKAGEVKLEIQVFENTTFAARDAEIRISDGRSGNNVYKIKQAPTLRNVNFSKTLNFTQTGDLFTDTVTVVANVAWEVSKMPEWVKSYEKTNNELMPQDGVRTEIELVIVADNSKFTTTKMEGEIEFSDKTGAIYPLPVEFAGFTPHVDFYVVNEAEEEVSVDKLVLAMNDQDEYMVKVIVKSNVGWAVTVPEWVEETNVIGEPQNALETEISVWLKMNKGEYDTDPLTESVNFDAETVNFHKAIDLVFPGVGNSYMDFEREAIFDRVLPADPFAEDAWTLSFEAYASNDNYKFVLIDYGSGDWLRNVEIGWASVMPASEEYSIPTRSPILKEKWEIKAWGANDQDQPRYAMMFMIPADMDPSELFDPNTPLLDDEGNPREDWGEPVYQLKPEWEGKGTHFSQAAAQIDYYFTVISGIENNRLEVGPEAKNYTIEVDTDCEQLTMMLDGQYPGMDSWVTMSFEAFSEGKLILQVTKNATDKSRKGIITLVDQNENELYQFDLIQNRQ